MGHRQLRRSSLCDHGSGLTRAVVDMQMADAIGWLKWGNDARTTTLQNGSRHKHTARYPGSGLSVEIKAILLPVWTIGIHLYKYAPRAVSVLAILLLAELNYYM